MDIVKTVVVAMVALSVGALGGGFLVYQKVSASVDELAKENQELAKRVQDLREKTELLLRDSRTSEREAEAQRAELERLQAEREAPFPDASMPVSEPGTTGEPLDREGRRVASSVTGRPESPAPPELSPEQREQYRAEYSQRLQERLQSYVDMEAQKTNDPVVQQRLAALREQADYMVQLLQDVRSATDDAQRADLQQQFNDARAGVQELVREQQDHMLRQVAAQNGITDPQRQQVFLESLRQAQESPFFRAPLLMWGSQGNAFAR